MSIDDADGMICGSLTPSPSEIGGLVIVGLFVGGCGFERTDTPTRTHIPRFLRSSVLSGFFVRRSKTPRARAREKTVCASQADFFGNL
jgi:hypothetical protein